MCITHNNITMQTQITKLLIIKQQREREREQNTAAHNKSQDEKHMQEFKRQINTIIRENDIPFLMLNIYCFTFALAVPFKNL